MQLMWHRRFGESGSSSSSGESSSGSSSSSEEDDDEGDEEDGEGEEAVASRTAAALADGLREELERCRRQVEEERQAGQAALAAKQEEFERFLREEPDQLAVENKELVKRCNEAEAAVAAQQAREVKLVAENAALTQRCSEVSAALSAQQAQEQKLAAENKALADKCRSLTTANEAAEAETEDLRTSIEQLQRRCEEQEEHAKDSLSKTDAAAQLGQLEAKLLLEQQARADLQAETKQRTNDLTDKLAAAERAAATTVEDLRAECQRLKEEHAQLEAAQLDAVVLLQRVPALQVLHYAPQLPALQPPVVDLK